MLANKTKIKYLIRLSVQYTQDVRGCPPAHIGRSWVSASTHRTSVAVRQNTQDVRGCPCVSVITHRTSVAVRVCPCVSVSTHLTSVAVHQYTYQHAGDWTVTPPILSRIVGTAMVRGNVQASLRTSRQVFHGRERRLRT